jgi:hypothetical protein
VFDLVVLTVVAANALWPAKVSAATATAAAHNNDENFVASSR